MSTRHRIRIVVAICLFAVIIDGGKGVASANEPPVAEAGLPRYAANDPVRLDGSGSYDPDGSGPLSYAWTQISGPTVVITEADTATPTISGFVQTTDVQHCRFELVVSDDEFAGLPDAVEVVIVPDFGPSTLVLENASFDIEKPTVIYFGGGYGGCLHGYAGQPWTSWPEWLQRANVIDFPEGYEPDTRTYESWRTYYHYADMIIKFLSGVAPGYTQPIQTIGWSTGSLPAVDVGLRINSVYTDARYAVNRVTLIDGGYCLRNSTERIQMFLDSSVAGKQCWIDSYVGTSRYFYPNVLNVDSSLDHPGIRDWYAESITGEAENRFHHGVVAGAYWSVVGPGKNLQLASATNAQTYRFKWYEGESSGHMECFDESVHPGRLPEPVTLLVWRDEFKPDGVVLSCTPSENAIRYQLICGTDPYHIVDYRIVSDTPHPPIQLIFTPDTEGTWWTIRACDEYGSTIHADPIQLSANDLDGPHVENASTGERYGSIELALYFAKPGDEIVLDPVVYREDIEFVKDGLRVESSDPNDPNIVATTIIAGDGEGPSVVFPSGADSNCVLAGVTVMSEGVSVSCGDVSPTLQNCTVQTGGPVAIEYLNGYPPHLVDCNILGLVTDPMYLASSPYPRQNALDVVTLTPVLSWNAAAGAIGHDVYFSEYEHEVNSATRDSIGTYKGTQPGDKSTYEPGVVEQGKRYYWRIDEVSGDDPNSPWKGVVWNFTTADYVLVLSVDDFEGYSGTESFEIWATWVDGYEDPSNGSIVGKGAVGVPETEIVHDGKQSMPLRYHNTKVAISEATRTWGRPQDWTTQEADSLTLYFCGEKSNSPQDLYLAIEDDVGHLAEVIHPDPNAVLATGWQRWQVPLMDLGTEGVNAAMVRKMTIGVGDRNNPQPGGSGRIYIDDIRLTKRMP